MPWASHSPPSAALGMLAAAVRRENPEIRVECRYPNVDLWAKLGPTYTVLAKKGWTAELVHAALMYQETEDTLRSHLRVAWAGGALGETDFSHSPEEQLDHIFAAVRDGLESISEELASGYDVIGFTTGCCQLFPALAACRLIKQRNQSVRTVLGGVGVGGGIGLSVLREYDFLDFLVRGEGERSFPALLQALQNGDGGEESIEGVTTRTACADARSPDDHLSLRLSTPEIEDLDSLPIPDYRDYDRLAQELGILWDIPLESSRGCWWNRVDRTHDPMHACHFCGLSSSSYREKGPARISDEMRVLSRRHETVRFRFLDRVLRPDGVDDLAEALEAEAADFQFFFEIRADISPYEILRIWEAGCRRVQLGAEGFSTSYLSRLGKGTSTIENLQAMKTCSDLGIRCVTNVMFNFPGSTPEEVNETAENILRFALVYQPSNITRYTLVAPSSVFLAPDRFGVENIRNHRQYAFALPSEVNERLQLFWLDYDCTAPPVDWRPVESAVEHWHALHLRLAESTPGATWRGVRALTYFDGGDFLQIEDQRHGSRVTTLDGPWRDVYLYCLQIRGLGKVLDHLGGAVAEDDVEHIVDHLVEQNLMYREHGRCLSLALAGDARAAADRIRRIRD
jgi:ribosomal peptide maturation radical SAM protein 1